MSGWLPMDGVGQRFIVTILGQMAVLGRTFPVCGEQSSFEP